MTYSRRAYLTAITAVSSTAITGCLGGQASNQTPTATSTPTTTTSTPTTTTSLDCTDGAQSATVHASYTYNGGVGTMNDVLDRVGSPDRYTNDSVFGSSSTALSTMYCQGDGRPCDREFLDAIESLQVARTNALEARSEFRDVQTHAEDCDVSEPDLFIEEAQSGVEITEKLHEAVNSFIESAKRHVDEERESFSRGQSFREGMSTYVEAQEIGLMAPEELHDRVTVYNG